MTIMKKYELTKDTRDFFGTTLYRIRALRSFGDVTEGELGGFIEKEGNLTQDGNAWVFGNAQVSGDARVSGTARVFGTACVFGNAQVSGDARVFGTAWVFGNAQVDGNARVFGNARVCDNALIAQTSDYTVAGPIGSRDDFTTFFRTQAGGVVVNCGCFHDTLDAFEKKVNKVHGDSRHGREYRLEIERARVRWGLECEKESA